MGKTLYCVQSEYDSWDYEFQTESKKEALKILEKYPDGFIDVLYIVGDIAYTIETVTH